MNEMIDYEGLWHALPHPAVLIDETDRIVAMNSAAEVFTSVSSGQAAGRVISHYVGETGALLDLVRQARQGPASRVQYNIDLSWNDQPPRVSTVHIEPLLDGSGQMLLLIQPSGIAEKMGRSLSHRSAARSVTGMAAMLAHEIKNPLAGISGAAQLLGMSLGDADAELAALIEEETTRISKLVERVEQFGEIRPSSRSPVNIHDILQRAELSAQSGFASHVRFVEEFDPSLPLTIGDADQLMQVALNLLKNAAEAAPKTGAVITLKTAFRPGVTLSFPGGRREGLPLEVTISDNGPGVAEDLVNDIFEPFVSSKPMGSGLGLALVSKIVADHGGIVEYHAHNTGATFKLLLPVWSAKSAADRDQKPTAQARSSSAAENQ